MSFGFFFFFLRNKGEVCATLSPDFTGKPAHPRNRSQVNAAGLSDIYLLAGMFTSFQMHEL